MSIHPSCRRPLDDVTTNARPNRNGDTPETFAKHGRKISNLARSLRTALADARADCLHGRNYQTVGSDPAALMSPRDADLARVDAYLTAALAAESFGTELETIGYLLKE